MIMKVLIKSTGEVKKVAEYATVTLDSCDSYGNPEQVSFEDIELISEGPVKFVNLAEGVNWKQVRIDASIAALQGLCNSCHDDIIREFSEREDKERSNVIGYLAVRIADSLIRELNKNNK